MPKSRIEAFSDGVFAIVITLLLLEIKVPALSGPPSEAAFARALWSEAPVIASCIVSFVVIAIVWVAHHQFWHGLRQSDWVLLWLNNLLLLFVIFIPIPTGMIGAYPELHTPVFAYGLVMTLLGLAFLAMRYYASFVAELVELPARQRRQGLIAGLISPILYGAATALAWPLPRLALAIYVLVPVIYFLRPPSGRGTRQV